jgi:hypothetical protein
MEIGSLFTNEIVKQKYYHALLLFSLPIMTIWGMFTVISLDIRYTLCVHYTYPVILYNGIVMAATEDGANDARNVLLLLIKVVT